ncbi:MAG: major facilitator superfamily 1 [Frankiales bacterium]|nr:major facilitator superfamily 1 [Frankiales bacterium]
MSLPRDARRYLLAVGVQRLGTGFTLPFTLIMLHEVRGIALPTVGLLMAIPGVVGLATVPVGGVLIDRFGPRVVLFGCQLLIASGQLLLAFATTPAVALVALLLNGVGLGPSFPAGNALLARLVPEPSLVSRAYGVQFTVINAAIGVGTLVSSAVVDVHRAVTFEALFVSAAVASLLMALLLPAASRPVASERAAPSSYRLVWQDRVFRRVCFAGFLFAMTGYAALDSGLPAFARVEGSVPPSTIALAFTVNTVLIVSLQLPVVRWVRSWRRTRALALAASLWGLSWLLLGLAPSTPVVLLFAALFGLGEVFQSPAYSPLVNALSSEETRGRYNALSGAMFSVAFVLSPALSGVLIGNDLAWVWITGLVVGSVLTAVVLLSLRSQLTDEQDGLLSLTAPVPG